MPPTSNPYLIIEPLQLKDAETPCTQVFFAGRMPIPPGINHSYKPIYNGIVGTEALQQFKADAVLTLCQGYHDWSLINAIRVSKRRVPLRVNLVFCFRYMWKNDIDGPIKFPVDAAFYHLELNDNLVTDLHVTKKADYAEPRTEIEIYCDLSSR